MITEYLGSGLKAATRLGADFLRRTAFVSAGIWILLLVGLMVGAGPLWTSFHRPAHLTEIAAESGSAAISFWGLPTVNHPGTRIAYAQTTETGLGIFVNDLAAGKTRLINEYKETNPMPGIGEFGLLPWSPDDASFAYTRNLRVYLTSNPDDMLQEIIVCHADTGVETVACQFAGRARWPTANSFFSWLSPDAFVYLDGRQQLHLVQRQVPGGWNDTLRLANSPALNAPVSCLTTMSNNEVIWLQGNTLWQFDVSSSNAPVKYFEPPMANAAMGNITRISYSPETGQFLLNCLSNKETSLWRLAPGGASPENPQRLQIILANRDVSWINGGKGFAYVSENQKKYTLMVQPDLLEGSITRIKLSTDANSFFSQGYTMSFTPEVGGRRLLIPTVVSNEFAPSIWEYDLESATMHCVAPYPERHWLPTVSLSPISGTITLPSGRKTASNIYFPADFDRHQKRRYPLVMANPYLDRYANAFASCGVIYVTSGGGAEMQGADEQKWEEDTWEFYQYLAGTSFVDTRRVFLAGDSRETVAISKFLLAHSSPWKGVILLNPSELPDIQALAANWRVPKILLGAGSRESYNQKRFQAYQENASKAGIRVDVSIQEGADHFYISQKSNCERMVSVMNFIFDD
jgi:hypothetical protein